MKVLATTSQSLLLVDCSTGESRVLHRGAGLYYGIARISSGFAVAARRRLVSSQTPREEERACILHIDRDLRLREVLEAPFPLRDVHQIAWFDERLWVTCSFDDMIAIYDGRAWERWIPEFPPVADPARPVRDVQNDRHHFNSFFVAEDEVGLLAHNHGPSDVHFFDRRTRSFRSTISLGRQAHDIWRDGNAVITCSSIEGKVVGSNGWEVTTGGFPRGVCFDARNRAIGISALSERGHRDFASAAIAVYDPYWRPLHYVQLVREGMVLDLVQSTDAEFDMADRQRLERVDFPMLERLDPADLAADQGSGANEST
ncbi:MAG TPA: hypothetical protein VF304_11575 [Casimicrobiaceae bacterium]